MAHLTAVPRAQSDARCGLISYVILSFDPNEIHWERLSDRMPSMAQEYENIFWPLFHQSSKNNAKGHPPIAWDTDAWPEEWKRVEYKQYPRFPQIQLPSEEVGNEALLLKTIRERSSRRDFQRSKQINNTEISTILRHSCGITREGGRNEYPYRAQASGGARFPIETYALQFRSSPELPSGVYHYNVLEHALEELDARSFSDEQLDALFVYPWVKDASLAIIMTAAFSRTDMKYGERGYRYILVEAGHIGQNIYLVSEALGLKCCAMGGVRDEIAERTLDVDGETESIVYSLILGK